MPDLLSKRPSEGEGGNFVYNKYYSPQHYCFYVLRNVVRTISSCTYHIPCFISKDIFGLLHLTASRSNKASCTRHTFFLKPVRKWNYFAMITLGLLKSMSL